ncbi:hypothetical protein L1987_08731 [Smallanthus sonchifolius]|uniref:Uncharacterized protein n=1 Tax=Smallanthus sonchifolius TaxID=185202 RepID=A0ACB9JMK2_9ASTR|nr:hypothetical protein L1987_08731 [Smallanthus sonchifolius]
MPRSCHGVRLAISVFRLLDLEICNGDLLEHSEGDFDWLQLFVVMKGSTKAMSPMIKEFSTHLEVKATPTFFFLNSKQIDKLVGANKLELQKKMTTIVDSQVPTSQKVLSNFVFSFSIISVLTFVTTLYNSGLKFGGPVVLVYGWLVVYHGYWEKMKTVDTFGMDLDVSCCVWYLFNVVLQNMTKKQKV